ncbi:MAG: hypothetical protein QF530_01915 [SAR202 cluster bacterium]|nr:hypothetical protein [SAR202 cluster bacterium]
MNGDRACVTGQSYLEIIKTSSGLSGAVKVRISLGWILGQEYSWPNKSQVIAGCLMGDLGAGFAIISVFMT